MLTLRRPHEVPCVQALNSDVEIKNLDTLKTKTFRPAECPRVTIEISGKPTQVFLTGSPFSIYNPPPGNTTDDFYINAAKPTGSKSNCSFTGATGGRVTAEQNYIMNFRAGNTSLAGEFVVLKQHAPNLPTFLVGMDILMTRLRGVAVTPQGSGDIEKISVHFGVDWTVAYPCEKFVRSLPPQKPSPWVLSLLRGLDEELIEEYLPHVVSRISRSFSEKTSAPEDTFVYGGSADQELVDDEDNATESDDFSYNFEKERREFHEAPLPVVLLDLATGGKASSLE
jgi:hypothetical protein